jgi:hypothetical protein
MLSYVGEGDLSAVGGLVLVWMLGHRLSDGCVAVVVLWRLSQCPNLTGEVV